VVTWLLNENNGSTEVTLHHEGTESFADAGPDFATENYQMGWDGFMSILKNYIYGLRKHTFQVEIHAPAEKVWQVLLNEDTFREWTNVFSEGSYYTGEMKQGGRIHFLSPDGSGMYANVAYFNPHSHIIFQHIGELKNFEEQPVDENAEKWSGTFESYILKESGGITKLTAEVDIKPDQVDFINDTFPKALGKIKEICERE
jgi:hypothetical protein